MLHIVDDEEIIRDSLTWLAQSAPPLPQSRMPAVTNSCKPWRAAANLTPLVNASVLDVRMPP